jgi:hypothetical protein
VEEACSVAWVQLLRRQPDRDSVAGWLWRVAVRETHRLQGVERRQQALHEDRSEGCDDIAAPPVARSHGVAQSVAAAPAAAARRAGRRVRLSRDLGRDGRLVADDRPSACARPQAPRGCALAASWPHNNVMRRRRALLLLPVAVGKRRPVGVSRWISTTVRGTSRYGSARTRAIGSVGRPSRSCRWRFQHHPGFVRQPRLEAIAPAPVCSDCSFALPDPTTSHTLVCLDRRENPAAARLRSRKWRTRRLRYSRR